MNMTPLLHSLTACYCQAFRISMRKTMNLKEANKGQTRNINPVIKFKDLNSDKLMFIHLRI